MYYNDFKGLKLSALGFGAMRLPLSDGAVDEAHVARMVDTMMENGVNYIDTAYPYHGGESERVLGRILASYPRESFYLASKYPGHQIAESYDPAAIFEEQLEKCGVEYFDFYLLHNVYEKSMDVYLDPKWGILDYFVEQKKLGRIRHLGFSTHGSLDCMKRFLDIAGEHMEFCQIQLNYLDWTLQNAKAKVELLKQYGLPVWVMEPMRGGKLASLPEEDEAKMKSLRPEDSIPSWGFRWLQGIEEVCVVLSGMSNMEQTQDNLRTFESRNPLNAEEIQLVMEAAERQKKSIPCTACRYCCDGCPKGLDIPGLLALYNDYRYHPGFTVTMAVEAMPADKTPDACIACGKCSRICPQGIDIPGALKAFSEELAKQPSWAEICRERAEAAKRNK